MHQKNCKIFLMQNKKDYTFLLPLLDKFPNLQGTRNFLRLSHISLPSYFNWPENCMIWSQKDLSQPIVRSASQNEEHSRYT